MHIVRKRRLASKTASLRSLSVSVSVLLALLGTSHPVFAARFVDMDGLWSTRAVNNLSDQGVIPAAEDGHFNPDSALNRATMARWLNAVFKPALTERAKAIAFADVLPNNDHLADFQAVTAAGLMPTTRDKDAFCPNGMVTREQFINIVTTALKLGPVDSATATKALAIYPDRATFAEDARDRIAQAQVNGLLALPPKSQKLEPTKAISRGIAAVWLERASTYKDKREIAMALAARTGGFNNLSIPQSMNLSMPQSSFRPGPAPQSAFAPGPAAQSAFMPAWSAQANNGMQSAFQPVYGQTPQPKFLPADQVANLDTGTSFKANLEGDAFQLQPGQDINATLQTPVFNGPRLAIPAGSRLTGKVTGTQNGMISMTFTRLLTPDGRQSSLLASATQARKAPNTASGARPDAFTANDIDLALDQPLLLYTGRRGF
jgi:S-layer homology domain